MEPKFQTSFIPKKPIVASQGLQLSPVKDINIFSVIATIIFLVTALASGGVFVYKQLITNQIVKADQDLNAAREAFQTEKIQELIDANSRIMATKNLLEKHVVVSELLLLLNALTVKKMRITDLTYNNRNGSPTVSMSAEAQTYNALADQGRIFSENEFVLNEEFSNFELADSGNVRVKFFANIDPTLVSYKKAVEAVSLNLIRVSNNQ